MNKLTSKLPADVDSVLMDLAQMFEAENGEHITYSNIIDWAEKAKQNDIANMRSKISDLADLDFMFDEDVDALYIATDIVKTINT